MHLEITSIKLQKLQLYAFAPKPNKNFIALLERKKNNFPSHFLRCCGSTQKNLFFFSLFTFHYFSIFPHSMHTPIDCWAFLWHAVEQKVLKNGNFFRMSKWNFLSRWEIDFVDMKSACWLFSSIYWREKASLANVCQIKLFCEGNFEMNFKGCLRGNAEVEKCHCEFHQEENFVGWGEKVQNMGWEVSNSWKYVRSEILFEFHKYVKNFLCWNFKFSSWINLNWKNPLT